MDKQRAAILYGFAFVAFSLLIAGLHWLLTGVSAEFGIGVSVGLFLGWGSIFILSRNAREL